MYQKNIYIYTGLFVALLGWFYIIRYDPFFWDTVQLASKHAHFFYERRLVWGVLPTDMDSGHPPLLGYYLAVCWTWLGKSLPVSHGAMLPFMGLTVGLLCWLGRQLGGRAMAYWLLPVVMFDPVMAGQHALVSPDVLLAAFFLLAVAPFLCPDGRHGGWRAMALLWGVVGLCAVSMRGMMTAGALFAFAVLNEWVLADRAAKPRLVLLVRQFVWFLPGFALAAAFLWYHHRATGWTGFHPQSPWAGAFARVDAAGLLRNMAIAGWRFTDMGRIAEWALLWWLWRRQRSALPRSVLLLVVVLAVFLLPSALLYQGLSAHRYFLPIFLALHVLAFTWLCRVSWPAKTKNILFAVLTVALATGNGWIYPTGISMDWDATLAHRPYHGLRAGVVRWLDQQGIDHAAVGSVFPNLATGELLHLNGDPRYFAELDFAQNRYIFASNIFNDLQAADHERLRTTWQLRYFAQKNGVWVAVFER